MTAQRKIWFQGLLDAPCMMPRVNVCVCVRIKVVPGASVLHSAEMRVQKGVVVGGTHFGQDFFVAQRTDHGFLEQCS